jgi:hypothetical protein
VDSPWWTDGEPNREDEKAVNILYMDGEWGLNDLNEYSELRHICEYELGVYFVDMTYSRSVNRQKYDN